MEIETYEIEEVSREPVEASLEAVELIERFSLAGQQNLLSPKNEDIGTIRTPYRIMTADEAFTYQTLCPEQRRIEQYDAQPIPLRVLQVYARAKQVEIFGSFWIWDRSSSAVKDPVLVARREEHAYGSGPPFILARWGEELESFPTLRDLALQMQRERLAQSLKSIQSRISTVQIDALTDEEIIAGSREFTVYGPGIV